jgi:hypothetical protein
MNEQVKQIVEKLTEKSRKGGVIWKGDYGKFGVFLPAGAIFIDEDEDSYLDTTYSICININRGECIYRKVVSEKKDKACFDLLRDLYWSVRDAYYNVGQVYENMLRGIENSDIIGGKTN